MKKILSLIILLSTCIYAFGVDLKTEGVDSAYLATVVGRAQKIVNVLDIKDENVALNVRNILANRYILLNTIHEAYSKAEKSAKQLTGEDKQHAIENAAAQRDAELYRHHFELEADLSNYLTPSQIETVKDELTYNVVKVTYDAHLDMIPTLTQEEKTQILAWLKEAREYAIDAGSSKDKHGWFGKYKGRINNWLSGRGYDLTKEREAWYKRIE